MNVAQALGFLFAGLVVGVLLGGMATFFFRRFMFDRQMRIAEKKASRMVADAKYEAKAMVDQAKQEVEKQKLVNTAEHRERKAAEAAAGGTAAQADDEDAAAEEGGQAAPDVIIKDPALETGKDESAILVEPTEGEAPAEEPAADEEDRSRND